jgi:hypothetical protein
MAVTVAAALVVLVGVTAAAVFPWPGQDSAFTPTGSSASARSSASGSGVPSPSAGSATSTRVPALVQLPLSNDGAVGSELYFGQLSTLVALLQVNLTLAVNDAYVQAHPNQCAFTVVFSGVAGPSAIVAATGFESSGWGGGEGVPSSNPGLDQGRVHQQIIVPPESAATGESFTGSSALVQGTSVTRTGEYTIASAGGWTIDGHPVSCSVT